MDVCTLMDLKEKKSCVTTSPASMPTSAACRPANGSGQQTPCPDVGSRQQPNHVLPVGPSVVGWWHADEIPTKVDIRLAVGWWIYQCQVGDQMLIKPNIGRTVSQQICQHWANVGSLNKCRPYAAQTQHRPDSTPINMLTLGRCQFADQNRHRPDTEPKNKLKSGQRRVVNIWPMLGCRPNANQTVHWPDSGPSTLVHLETGPMSLCRQCTCVDIQLMLSWHLAMSFQYVADEELIFIFLLSML